MTIGQSSVDMSLWARYKLSLCVHVQKRTQVSVYRITQNGPNGFGWGQAGYFKVGAFLHMWRLRTLSTITYYSLLRLVCS